MIRYKQLILAAVIIAIVLAVWRAGLLGKIWLRFFGQRIYSLAAAGNLEGALKDLKIAEVLWADMNFYDRDGRNYYTAIAGAASEKKDYKLIASLLERPKLDLASGDLSLLAVAYEKLGQFDKANQVLEMGLRRYPAEEIFYLLKGMLLLQNKQYNDAKAILAKAAQLFPQNSSYSHLIQKIINLEKQQ